MAHQYSREICEKLFLTLVASAVMVYYYEVAGFKITIVQHVERKGFTLQLQMGTAHDRPRLAIVLAKIHANFFRCVFLVRPATP